MNYKTQVLCFRDEMSTATRLKRVAKTCKLSVSDVIRACIDGALDAVEKRFRKGK